MLAWNQVSGGGMLEDSIWIWVGKEMKSAKDCGAVVA